MVKPAWLGSANICEGGGEVDTQLQELCRRHGDDLPVVDRESVCELAGQEVLTWAPIPIPLDVVMGSVATTRVDKN